MNSQTWGKVTARGSEADVAFVRKALDEAVNVKSPPIEDRLARPFAVEVHTRAEFLDAGAIIPGTRGPRRPRGIAAEGHVMKGGELWVRADIVAHRAPRARHIVRHEISHVLPLTDAKRKLLMTKMNTAGGNHPTNWRGGAYELRPNECYADTMAEAMSGIDSPWDDFAYYDLDVADKDVPTFLTISFAQVIPDGGTSEAETPDPPVVEPTPPEPSYIVELRAADAEKAKRLSMIENIAGANPEEVNP